MSAHTGHPHGLRSDALANPAVGGIYYRHTAGDRVETIDLLNGKGGA